METTKEEEVYARKRCIGLEDEASAATTARGRKAYAPKDGGAGRSLGFSCVRCLEAVEPTTGV
jgi:hypothetical protein